MMQAIPDRRYGSNVMQALHSRRLKHNRLKARIGSRATQCFTLTAKNHSSALKPPHYMHNYNTICCTLSTPGGSSMITKRFGSKWLKQKWLKARIKHNVVLCFTFFLLGNQHGSQHCYGSHCNRNVITIGLNQTRASNTRIKLGQTPTIGMMLNLRINFTQENQQEVSPSKWQQKNQGINSISAKRRFKS